LLRFLAQTAFSLDHQPEKLFIFNDGDVAEWLKAAVC
jgi:hypothetical protein